jgi:hypothetical protein
MPEKKIGRPVDPSVQVGVRFKPAGLALVDEICGITGEDRTGVIRRLTLSEAPKELARLKSRKGG